MDRLIAVLESICDPVASSNLDALATRERVWTYGELLARSAAIQTLLDGDRDTVVGLLLPKGPDLYASMIACAASGITYCPLDAESPELAIQSQLQAAGVSTVIAPSILRWMQADGRRTISLQSLNAQEWHAVPRISTKPSKWLYRITTSGSTGEPKVIAISREAVANLLDWSRQFLTLNSHDRVSQFSNPFFDLSVLEIWGALAAKACLVPLVVQGDRLRPARVMVRERISVWISVPTAVDLMASDPTVDPTTLHHLRLFVFCGEPLKRHHVRWLMENTHTARVVNTYGPTEATVLVTAVDIPRSNWEQLVPDTAPLGEPIPGARVWLDGSSLDEGELCISGCCLGSPVGNSGTDWIVLSDGERAYRTGDLVALRQEHLYFVARKDRQVKIRGVRVELGAVEAVASEVGLGPSCAVVNADRLILVREDGILSEDEAMTLLNSRLPPFLVPNRIFSVPRLPTSRNGKLDIASIEAFVEVQQSHE